MSNSPGKQDELVSFPNGVVVLQNKIFSSTNRVIHATSTRHGGDSTGEFGTMNLGLTTGDDSQIVIKNRKMFFETFGLSPENIVYTQQTHSDHIVIVDEKVIHSFSPDSPRYIPDTDALITRLRNVPLAILTADCLPIFLFDRETPAIGLVHAGWRGTKSHIADKTLQTMKKHFDSKPENICAWISAGINVCCYQVGDDIRREFSHEYGKYIEAVNEDKLNLVEINRFQLLNAGIPQSSIFATSYCTSHDNELFYSYRRDGKKSGRMVSVFMLK